MGIFLLLGLAVPYAFAVRCYDFINTNDNRNTMKTWSYIEQYDTNNEMTWLASRSCGTPNLCKREGCLGTRNDKTCCCRDELCNASTARGIILLLLISSAFCFVNVV
ncbi:hypothetical protein RB195_012621 [Necator americanus]|uniref:ET module n=1 Tax=Necator americanus TaxID=51031 RepID=A0ABR1DRS2_NECAM